MSGRRPSAKIPRAHKTVPQRISATNSPLGDESLGSIARYLTLADVALNAAGPVDAPGQRTSLSEQARIEQQEAERQLQQAIEKYRAAQGGFTAEVPSQNAPILKRPPAIPKAV